MLRVNGKTHTLCDGISRRDALRIGTLGMGGLTLTDLLRAESAAGIRGSHKSVIMIYMVGAPSHQDMYDLKMDAPMEIRGSFLPIPTTVPGIEVCEHMPGIAKAMDKCVPLRSVYGSPNGAHDSFICYTGRSTQNQPPGGWPSIGSTVSRLLGPTNKSIPPFVGLAPDAGHPPYGSPGHPGFLGVGHAAFRPSGPARKDMVLNGVTLDRLDDRKSLLSAIDGFRRDADATGTFAGLDTINEQALNILTSSRLAEALDVSKEPEPIRQRYGKGDPKNFGDGAPRNLEHFLVARRLVEAGARVVTLNFGRWDWHSNNFGGLKDTHLPQFDQGLSALIEDIYEKGMQDDAMPVAITGRRSVAVWWPAADSGPDRLSARPIVWARRSPIVRFTSARFTHRCIASSASIRPRRRFRIFRAGHSTSSTTASRCRNCSELQRQRRCSK